MKHSLQIRQSRRLQLNAQLTQSLRLLQLGRVDLDFEIQNKLETNPLLEGVDSLNYADDPTPSPEEIEPLTQAESEPIQESPNTESEMISTDYDSLHWDDRPYRPHSESSNEFRAETDQPMWHDAGQDLRTRLLEELALHRLSRPDELIAHALIGSLDDRGYLPINYDELRSILDAQDSPSDKEIDSVLHLVQSLYLPGIAARDLRECLMLQLDGLDKQTAHIEDAKKLVSNHLDRLGKHQYTALGQALEIDQSRLAKVIALIQSLNPKPGEELTPSVDHAVSPDVVVKKVGQEWVVRLVRPDGSVIRISQDYRNYQHSPDKKTSEYIKNHLQDAQWFIRSLEQRDQTILKVTQTIVSMQRNFMESGDMGVVPMTLRDISNELDIHESTVSRAIDQKNILTPYGLFALKYFFSASLGGSNGAQTSARAAQAKIRKVIESESAQHPVSDNQLVAMLNQDGITIARRTVAKYREQMKILPAAQRRSIT